MSEEKRKPVVQYVRGFPFLLSERHTRKKAEDAMDLVPEDGDVIIASYPKTGTTWMQYIVLQILSKGESYPSFDDVTFKVIPYIEMVGIAPLLSQTKPRTYKHHIAYNFVQKSDKSKVIYTYRHPEDTIVSYYHFMRNMYPQYDLDFNQFVDNFATGKISYGSYFEHVLSFYEHRNDANLLMVSYEKLHANHKEGILRIAKFLGEEHHQRLLEDEELLNGIILRTSFDYMKKNLSLTHPDVTAGIRQPDGPSETVKFFRKGTVGDGKTELTDAQRQTLKEAAFKVLKETSIISEWYKDEK